MFRPSTSPSRYCSAASSSPRSIAAFGHIVLDHANGPETVAVIGNSQVALTFDGLRQGDAADDDGNGLDEVAARLIDLELTGRSSLGDVRISLDPLQLSSGVVEETVNNTDGVLDVAPWAGGTAMATFNAVVRIEIGDDIYRMPAPMTLSATISHTTAAVGEGFQFSTRTELVDESGQPSSLFLVSAGLTPSPEHPWQNPVSRFDVDNNGPSHTVVEGLYMGGGVDAEAAVTPSLTASHNKNDKHRVEALARELSDKHGLRVWFDVWEMLPGTIEQQCEQGIRQSRFTVVAASRAALNSE